LGRWRRALVVAALALPASACTLLTSLNGLTGGSPSSDGGTTSDAPANPSDTGIPPVDGPVTTPDSASESGPDDGGVPDAAVDAGDGAVQLFFDDFDQDPADAAAFTAPWDHVSGLNAKATRNGATFVSSPDSMLIVTDALTVDTQQVDCGGYKSFPTSPTTGVYTLSFYIDVQVADETKNSDAVLTAFELFDPSGARWALQLEAVGYSAEGLSVNFSENGTASDGGSLPYTSDPAASLLPIGVWTLVTIEVDLTDPDGPGAAAGANTATLTFATTVAATAQLHVGTVGGTPEILMGVSYVQPLSDAWTVRYDNVSLTYR
jgi:hypothetical protein